MSFELQLNNLYEQIAQHVKGHGDRYLVPRPTGNLGVSIEATQ